MIGCLPHRWRGSIAAELPFYHWEDLYRVLLQLKKCVNGSCGKVELNSEVPLRVVLFRGVSDCRLEATLDVDLFTYILYLIRLYVHNFTSYIHANIHTFNTCIHIYILYVQYVDNLDTFFTLIIDNTVFSCSPYKYAFMQYYYLFLLKTWYLVFGLRMYHINFCNWKHGLC